VRLSECRLVIVHFHSQNGWLNSLNSLFEPGIYIFTLLRLRILVFSIHPGSLFVSFLLFPFFTYSPLFEFLDEIAFVGDGYEINGVWKL